MRIGQILRRYFLPLKLFAELYSVDFMKKKLSVRVWDSDIYVLNQHLTVLVGNIPLFKDCVSRRLETLLKATFALAGPALQLAIVVLSVCQAVANWTGRRNKKGTRTQSFV